MRGSADQDLSVKLQQRCEQLQENLRQEKLHHQNVAARAQDLGEQLSARVNELERHRQQAPVELGSCRTEISRLNQAIEDNARTYRMQLALQDQEQAKLSTVSQQGQAKIVEFSGHIKKQNREIRGLQNEIAKGRLTQDNAREDEMQLATQKYEQITREYQTTIIELRSQTTQRDGEISRLTNELKEVTERLKEARGQMFNNIIRRDHHDSASSSSRPESVENISPSPETQHQNVQTFFSKMLPHGCVTHKVWIWHHNTAKGEFMEGSERVFQALVELLITNHWVAMDNKGKLFPLPNAQYLKSAIVFSGEFHLCSKADFAEISSELKVREQQYRGGSSQFQGYVTEHTSSFRDPEQMQLQRTDGAPTPLPGRYLPIEGGITQNTSVSEGSDQMQLQRTGNHALTLMSSTITDVAMDYGGSEYN